MKLTATVISLALGISTAGCGEKTAIEGNWAIDLTATIEEAQSSGASASDIQQLRATFANGKMRIDSDRITLTIPGFRGSEVFKYKIASKEGSCFHLLIEAATHKYCANGNYLEVHDPSSRVIAVYRKT